MKIEMHVHTSNVSPCSKMPAEILAKELYKAGYGAAVLTDHFNDYVLDNFAGSKLDKVDRYLEGYRIVSEHGEKIGLKVFLGVEVCLLTTGGWDDFLIYGIDEDFLIDTPTLYNLTQEELYHAVDSYGGLVYQAHPFRMGCRPLNPYYIHGVEVHNGSNNNNEENIRAFKWASEYSHLKWISGSDAHEIDKIDTGGIIVPEDENIYDSKSLAKYLKNNRVELIKESENGYITVKSPK
ncbi:MAG: transposase [Ruminococcaceae bacterium]|nr:transposase [Oscillospiraceae bacterium]